MSWHYWTILVGLGAWSRKVMAEANGAVTRKIHEILNDNMWPSFASNIILSIHTHRELGILVQWLFFFNENMVYLPQPTEVVIMSIWHCDWWKFCGVFRHILVSMTSGGWGGRDGKIWHKMQKNISWQCSRKVFSNHHDHQTICLMISSKSSDILKKNHNTCSSINKIFLDDQTIRLMISNKSLDILQNHQQCLISQWLVVNIVIG